MNKLSSRVAALSPEKRALLEQLLRKQERLKTATQQSPTAPLADAYDVVILGGGLAGLSVALHCERTQPDISVLVIEKEELPLPESKLKVGESTVEIASRYFSNVLGMKEHLHTQQLPKLGLRFFFTAADNSDIAQRVEMGSFSSLWYPSYQLHRARFENALADKGRRLGVVLQDGCRVRAVSLGEPHHTVTLETAAEEQVIKARWLVDASGRASILKRQLGLTEKVGHDANAVWFHIGEDIDIDEWSDNAGWLQRMGNGLRRLSTNHLMGPGYWVWLIPLPNQTTSIGIVADATLHPLHQFNKFEKALAWLWEHEPACAQAVAENRGKLTNFRVQRHFAYSCPQVYATERWCLIGEAAVFTDPLYSLGSDFIAFGSTFITDLIARDRQGQNIHQPVDFYNWFFLNWFHNGLAVYENNYPVMDNGQVMTAKIAWDFALYWGCFGLLFYHDKLCDLAFMIAIKDDIQRVLDLNVQLQAFFREWAALKKRDCHSQAIDYSKISFLYDLHRGMGAGLDDDALKEQFAQNVALFESLAVALFRKAASLLAISVPDSRLNPYAITLQRDKWEANDGLSASNLASDEQRERLPDIEKLWLDSLVVA
jgi:flavin-dependent dehydrogenase